MTGRSMEHLNRRTRILRRLRAGEAHAPIAIDEKVARTYVSKIGTSAGIRVSQEERSRRMKQAWAIRKLAVSK